MWWRIFVIKHFRTAILAAVVLVSLPATILFVPGVSAGPIPAAASTSKKKNKVRKSKKQKVLKGHHVKHSPKPA
jgi:hypothetical protein